MEGSTKVKDEKSPQTVPSLKEDGKQALQTQTLHGMALQTWQT